MARTAPPLLLVACFALGGAGCQHPSVTAVSLNPHHCDHKYAFLYDPCKEPEGIPFYLPKPLLIISKNFRNIEETKVGLTNSAPIPNYFDDQAKYADLNARTNFAGLDGNAATGGAADAAGPSPGQSFPDKDATHLATAAPARVYSDGGAPVSPGVVAPDGLKPEAFFTYHIIFVPDLTQKYGLKVKGGAGEIRAAMNLVNGWQFTGLGPYYMKDSSTAQNTLAGGITANLAASGVADVVKAVASMKPGAGVTGKGQDVIRGGAIAVNGDQVRAVSDALRELNPRFLTIPAYAEISIYEPYLSPEGTMEWKVIAEKCFNRDVVATDFEPQQVLGLLQSAAVAAVAVPVPSPPAPPATVGGPFTPPATGAPVPAGSAALGGPAAPAVEVHPAPPVPLVPVHPDPAAPGAGEPPSLPVRPGSPAAPEAPPAPKVPGAVLPGAAPGTPPAPGVPEAKPIPGGATEPPRTRRPGKGVGSVRGVPFPGLPGPGAAPAVEGPRVSRVPGTTRGGLRDDALVRTQAGPPAAPRPAAGLADALARTQGVGSVTVSVLGSPPGSPLGPNGEVLTTDRSPALVVSGARAGSRLELRREGLPQPVVASGAVPAGGGSVTLIDPTALTSPAESYVYAVDQVGADGSRSRLSGTPLAVKVVATQAPAPDPVQTPRPVGTVSDVASTDLMRQFTAQLVPLVTASRAAAVPVPAPGVAVPVAAGPTSGNQVNVNQFFGKTHLGGLAAPGPRRFSLFHHKEKPRKTVRTLALGDLDADATAVAVTPTAPGSPLAAQVVPTAVQPRAAGAAPPGALAGPGAATTPGP